jgi:hypothetical protein
MHYKESEVIPMTNAAPVVDSGNVSKL